MSMSMSEPRTPREVADAGLSVLIACRCGHEEAMDPLMVEFIYGEDFDLRASSAELTSAFRCKGCGASRPLVRIGRPQKAQDFVVERPSRKVADARG